MILNVIVFACFLIAINLNYQRAIDFYSLLILQGVIVNPFQTSEAGISIRFNGVFNSAFVLASFCCIAISYYYFRFSLSKFKFLILFCILSAMVILSYNRNGIIAYAVCSSFVLIYAYARNLYFKLTEVYFYTLLVMLIVFPCVILIYGDALFESIGAASDHSALTKVSTLFSRIDSWITVLDIDSLKELLIGTGLVQGLGDNNDNFYVDNGYLYLLNQGGVLLLVFYIVSWVMMFTSLLKGLKYCFNDQELKKEISMCLLLILVSMTVAFLNNLFFESFFLVLVFMKCLTVNNKISLYYEKK